MLGLIITAALISLASAQTCSYEYLCADHTMCQYPTTVSGEKCLPPVCSGVGAAARQEIVDTHNRLRRKVAKGLEMRGSPGPQPPASNMQEITWDDELATIAQRWCYQCINEHDGCRNVDRFFVGQNFVNEILTGEEPNCTEEWEKALTVMFDQVSSFDNSKVSPFMYNDATPQYSQMMWADSYKVGCGFTAYSDSTESYNKLYVCNYGPGGNYVGSSMYKVGATCTACPTATPNCSDGLCV